MSEISLPAAYFDRLYADDPDPWRFRSSDYEREKYARTVAALDGRRFGRAVEIGCSIGELTAQLAPLCDDLLGVDIAQAALDTAAERTLTLPKVHFQRLSLPAERPQGVFDLIVLSEVLYYFSSEDLKRVAAWVEQALAPNGVVLAVHWLGETPDYPQTGDEAVEAFIQALEPALTTDRRSRQAQYRLDRLVHRG